MAPAALLSVDSAGLHYQSWGEGEPLIALHPLAVESTAFRGVARDLAPMGLETIAVDLPGFGCTPAPEGVPLTPRVLAEPVIAMARSLPEPPLLMGMSLGGRVALEAVLTDPGAFRGVALIAPYLPWRSSRRLLGMASMMDPAWAERLPLERYWGELRRASAVVEGIPILEDDWLARAAVRVTYYSTCPATRMAFLSASRELALDPAFGPTGLWPRLEKLSIPAAFLWARRDWLIPSSHADDVTRTVPNAARIEVGCCGHFVNFRHFRCMNHAIGRAVSHITGEHRLFEPLESPCVNYERRRETMGRFVRGFASRPS